LLHEESEPLYYNSTGIKQASGL